MNDYGKLAHWSKLMRSGDVVIGAIRARMADDLLTLIDEGFERQADPYERAWAPKKRPDGRRILHGPTGRLRGGWHKVFSGARKVRVEPSVDYASAHQAPRQRRRPRRAMVPFGRRPLPRRWRARFAGSALVELKKHFRS